MGRKSVHVWYNEADMSVPLLKQTETKPGAPVEQPVVETLPVDRPFDGLEGVSNTEKEIELETPVFQESEETVDTEPVETDVPLETAPPSASIAITLAVKDKVITQIEEIMSEDLTDAFLKLPADKQQEFKQKGEEAAGMIKELLTAVKINAKKIFEILRAWMKLIPGVNRFFLEQEAKIKTDKILRLKP